jgi:hypothetical protein
MRQTTRQPTILAIKKSATCLQDGGGHDHVVTRATYTSIFFLLIYQYYNILNYKIALSVSEYYKCKDKNTFPN